MPNSWGRPPRHELWQDIQALAFWVLLIGVGALLLFPNLFGEVYSSLTAPVTQLADTAAVTNESGYEDYAGDGSYSPNADTNANSLYATGNPYGSSAASPYLGNEVAAGYWVIFVADGDFKQLSLTSEDYTFLLRLMEKDQGGEGKNTLILAANGQIRKFTVTAEIYQIITNIAAIEARGA